MRRANLEFAWTQDCQSHHLILKGSPPLSSALQLILVSFLWEDTQVYEIQAGWRALCHYYRILPNPDSVSYWARQHHVEDSLYLKEIDLILESVIYVALALNPDSLWFLWFSLTWWEESRFTSMWWPGRSRAAWSPLRLGAELA